MNGKEKKTVNTYTQTCVCVCVCLYTHIPKDIKVCILMEFSFCIWSQNYNWSL